MEAGAVHPAQIGGGVEHLAHLLLLPVGWRYAFVPSTLLITRFWAALFAKKTVLLYIYHCVEQVFSSLDYRSRWG